MLFRPQALNPRELEGRALERWGGFNCGISRNFLLTLGQYTAIGMAATFTEGTQQSIEAINAAMEGQKKLAAIRGAGVIARLAV